jgi:pimeloyl-ACP methyl ester carboxylesterase
MRSSPAVGRSLLAAASILALAPCALAQESARNEITSSDLFAPHVSTLAANPGQQVGLHLHRAVAAQPSGNVSPADRVVLFVHGATMPGTPAFAFNFKDYSWMGFLARAGFDAWAIDMSGYGSSPRPMMDDPCNVDLSQQETLVKRPLPSMCIPHYALKFKTSRDDWAELDSAVEFIRRTTGANKVSLVAWSAGAPRVGGYAALHPDKVNRIVFYAPDGPRPGYRAPDRPEAGFPIALQTRFELEKKRWDPNARCSGQVEPGVRDALWSQIMQWDLVGANWGPEEGVMRVPTLMSGWSTEQANALKMPVMVIVGDSDAPDERRKVFDAAGSADKVFVKLSCASHFAIWERQHKTLQNVSLAWLRDGKLAGATRAAFEADVEGNVRQTQ